MIENGNELPTDFVRAHQELQADVAQYVTPERREGGLQQIKDANLPPLRESHDPTGCHMLGRPHRGKCFPPERAHDIFTCPDCKVTSPQINDVQNSYCFVCHQFKNESWQQPRCMEPFCIDFGDPSFGEGTCPSEHAAPPARRERP